MRTCSLCGTKYFSTIHNCPPSFSARVALDDGEHEIPAIFAKNAGEAAEQAVAMVDAGYDFSFPIASGSLTVKVDITGPAGATSTHFVDGRIEPAYYVRAARYDPLR